MNFRTRILSILAGASLVPALHGAGFQIREQSPSAQGNAFAGVTAGGSDLSGMFFNPAIMSQFQGSSFLLGASSIAPSTEFSNGTGSRSALLGGSAIQGPGSHPDAAKDAIVPSLYAMWSLSKDLKVGFSVNVPFGLTTEYAPDFIGRYHAIKSDLKTIDIAPAIAYRMNDQWSFGFALVARQAKAELTNAVDFGSILAAKHVPPAAGGTPGQFDGVGKLEGSKWGYGAKIGVTYAPTESFRLGFAHHTAMNLTLKGDATFQFPTNLPAPGLGGLQAAGFKDGAGEAELNLPAMTSLGANLNLTATLSVQAEVAQTAWSKFKEIRVKFATGLPDSTTTENWKDTMFYSIGLTWKATDAATLRFGVASDQGAVQDGYLTPRIPDADRTWIAAGVGYAFSKNLGVDLGYSHLYVKDSTIHLVAGGPTDSSFFRGNLTGSTKNKVDILAIQVRYSF